jgi:hypothetical protein
MTPAAVVEIIINILEYLMVCFIIVQFSHQGLGHSSMKLILLAFEQ